MTNEPEVSELLTEAWKKRRLRNYDKAKELVVRAQTLCMEEDHFWLGRIFHIRAQFESDHDRPEKALEYCQQSVEHYSESENTDRIAHSTRHMADIQRRLNRFEEAESNYRKSLHLYRNNLTTAKGDLANAMRGFGLLLERIDKIEEAIKTWTEVKELYRSCNLMEGVREADKRLDELNNR